MTGSAKRRAGQGPGQRPGEHPRQLAGRVVIVAGADTPSGSQVARSCTADGAVVVLVGDDAGTLGALAADLLDDGARCALFVGDPRDDSQRAALAELVSELFDRGT